MPEATTMTGRKRVLIRRGDNMVLAVGAGNS